MGKRGGDGSEILREPYIIRSIKGPAFLYLIYLKDKVDGSKSNDKCDDQPGSVNICTFNL